MFIATAAAICSLGHGLRTLTAVPRSTLDLHPSGVAKSSTSFGSDKDGNIISAGWQVILTDLIWQVNSRSGEAGLLAKGERL